MWHINGLCVSQRPRLKQCMIMTPPYCHKRNMTRQFARTKRASLCQFTLQKRLLNAAVYDETVAVVAIPSVCVTSHASAPVPKGPVQTVSPQHRVVGRPICWRSKPVELTWQKEFSNTRLNVVKRLHDTISPTARSHSCRIYAKLWILSCDVYTD